MIRLVMVSALCATAPWACTRTELGPEVDCGFGTYALVNNNPFCVYPGGVIESEDCPEAVPHAVSYAGSAFCAYEEAPEVPLLAAALQQVGALGDAEVGEGAVDAGLFIIDGEVP